MTRDEQNNLLEAVAGICLRCFVLAVCLLLLWFVFYLLAADWAYSMHSRCFDLSRREFELFCYGGSGLVKIFALLFFLFPYISIKLVLRKK
ncbi:MAG: DUF6868 family protein [Planctomycetota bacterium]